MSKKKKPIAVLDIETDPFKKYRSPKPFLAGWFDGKRTRTFWGKDCIAECWASVRKELRGYVIYWHNGGKFDFRYFFSRLIKAEAKVRNIKGRAAQFILPDGTEFRDSYCILPVSLKATGEKKEIDYAKMEAECRKEHRDEIIDYWKNDLWVTFDKVTEFVAEYGSGLTLAGRTFAQLKENFDINPPKASEEHDSLFRQYYYGGRVEFFELGHLRGTFRVIDINSAYPAAMLKEHAFGTEFICTSTLPKSRAAVETSFVHFRGTSRGGLPFRDERGALSFAAATGEFRVTGWEFVAAQDAGAVDVETIYSVYTPLSVQSFRRFVEYFYAKKKNAEKGSSEELFSKLVLNSCYGRFALNVREFRDVQICRAGKEPEENTELRKQVRGYVLRNNPNLKGAALSRACRDTWERVDSRDKWELVNKFDDVRKGVWEKPAEIKSTSFFNVATAASITGAVRAFLFRSLRKVRRPVYCDTDSIICEDTGDLPLSRELGDWKLEAISVKDGLWIAGKKLYAMNLSRPFWKELKPGAKGGKRWNKWKTAAKGVRLSPAQLCRVAEGETVKTTAEAPTFSLFTTRSIAGSRGDFIRRTIRRDDLRKKNLLKKC